MARPLLLVPLVVIGLLLTATPATAETTAKVDGNVIKITIVVDVVHAKGKTGPDGTSLVDHWSKILQDTWGAAFNQLPYKNCFKLELKIKLNERDADFDAKKGNHRIIVGAASGGGFEGTGFDGAPKETSRNGGGDGTRSFENDRDGAIPVDAPPTVVAHEFGHLFGLGDDRTGGAPKPGRDIDTVMVGGVPGVDLTQSPRIDQNLIDRIGKVLERYLKDQGKEPLPKCETWTGPFGSTHTGAECTGGENGTVTLAVVRDSVSGTIESSGSSTCTSSGFTVTLPTSGSSRLAGTLDDGRFRLHVVELSPTFSAAHVCLVEQIFEIPVERGTGSAEFTFPSPSGDVYTCGITVERDDEDEPVG